MYKWMYACKMHWHMYRKGVIIASPRWPSAPSYAYVENLMSPVSGRWSEWMVTLFCFGDWYTVITEDNVMQHSFNFSKSATLKEKHRLSVASTAITLLLMIMCFTSGRQENNYSKTTNSLLNTTHSMLHGSAPIQKQLLLFHRSNKVTFTPKQPDSKC